MRYEQRSFRIKGRRYCVGLEPEFWRLLEETAEREHLQLVDLVLQIDQSRALGQSLSSSVRCYLVNRYRRLAEKIPD